VKFIDKLTDKFDALLSKVPETWMLRWKKSGIEWVFGISALVCFGVYWVNLNQVETVGFDHQPLAELEEGQANRKQSGSAEMIPTKVGDRFYNHDIISVPPTTYAVLRFLDDGSEMVIRGGSFISLNRSLRLLHTTQIVVMQGNVDLKKKYWNFRQSDYDIQTGKVKGGPKPTPTASPSEEPSGSPSDEPSGDPNQPKATPSIAQTYNVHPKPNATLLKPTGTDADIIFSWQGEMTGEIQVMDETGKTVTKVAVGSMSQVTVKLPLNKKYTWKVHGQDKDIGPFNFTLYSLKGHGLGGFIDNKQSNATVEMLQ
jgi:hypothetical protein